MFLINFFIRRLVKILLNSVTSIFECLQMVPPTIILDFFGLIFSTKVIFKSLRVLDDKWLAIYRSVPPAKYSVGACSKEFLSSIFWVIEVFFAIQGSVMAITLNWIFVDYSKIWSSSKLLFSEPELIWSKVEFSLLGIFTCYNSSKS